MKQGVVPLPPDLASLPTIEAEFWVQVDPDPGIRIEGPAFDRQDNLFVTSTRHGVVYRVTPQKDITAALDDKDVWAVGSAIHKDGRLFLACGNGKLVAFDPGTGEVDYIKPRFNGKPERFNDLVFDSRGNLYATDFTGTVPDPTGGVYRFSADFTEVSPIYDRLASANGVSLTPEGNALWVAESARNAIVRIGLSSDGVTLDPHGGVSYAYYGTGSPGGPDSNKVDAEGNLYQCIHLHGRVLVLNAHGIPVANVIVPGRDEGRHLRTTNLAFKPGTSEGYITIGGEGEDGPCVYRFPALAEGLPLYSHS